MNTVEYTQAFRQLGIKVQPLPNNYSPDIFGKMLMSSAQQEADVSYSSNTINKNNNGKESNKI
jgi:hypothetical protein